MGNCCRKLKNYFYNSNIDGTEEEIQKIINNEDVNDITEKIAETLKVPDAETSKGEFEEQIMNYGFKLEKVIKKEIENNRDNFINVKDAVKKKNENEQIYALGKLGESLEKAGINIIISKERNEDENSAIVNNQIISSGLLNKSKYEIHINEEDEIKKQKILNDKYEKINFIRKWRKKIAKEFGMNENMVYISNLREGSITFDVIFKTDDFMDLPSFKKQNLNIDEKMKNWANTNPEIKSIYQKNIVGSMKLTLDMLDSRGNQYPGNWAGRGEKRGGYEYFPPNNNWIGYGLKVLDCYDNGNNDWIAMNGNPNEWAVAYHGTDERAVKPVCQGKFWSTRAEGATGQKCEGMKNINPWSQAEYDKCGEGAYCSPHLEYANSYSSGVVIMCRVNPKKIRIPQGQYEKNEWITDGTKNTIRPYRVLIRKE